MEANDYVSYELAIKLKECGFDEPCDHYYTPNKAIRIVKDNALAPEISNNRFLDEIDDGCCTAVPLWHAQKWLREKKKLHILVDSDLYGKWYYKVFPIGECCMDEGNSNYVTYEQALSAGISAALDLLAGKEGEG